MGERVDAFLYNEACAFSLFDGAQLERITNAGDAWDLLPDLDAESRALVMELVQDDPFNARIVIDDELAEDELGWVGHATGVIEIGDDGVMLAGGFDADVLAFFVEDGESEYCTQLAVPTGRWRVDLYTFITSVNAGACLGAEIDEAAARLAAVFEATDRGPWPRWLARLCHETWLEEHPLWSDPDTARAEGRLQIDDDSRPAIDLLVQLRPAEGDFAVTPRDNEGMLDPAAGGRWPEGLPRPPMSDSLEREDDELDEPPDLGWLVDHSEASALMERFAPVPLESAVEIALDEFDLAVLVGWFIDPAGTQVLAVELPVGAEVEWPWVHAPAPVDDRTGLVFDCHQKAEETRKNIAGLSDWTRSLPSGTRLILAATSPDSDEVLLALSGELSGAVWQVDATQPVTGSDTVTAMLRIARWVDDDEPLRAVSEQELHGIGELLDGRQRSTGFRVPWRPEGLQVPVDEDNRAEVAMQVYRHRFAEVLPGLAEVLAEESEVAAQLAAIQASITRR